MVSQTNLEKRVLSLVKQHCESPIRATGRMVTVTKSREVYGGRGKRYSPEYYEGKEPETVYDTSRREAAISGLVQIGQPAVTILTAILVSEKGDYPNSFSNINDGVLPALGELADEETSIYLLEPFQQKVRKVANLNAEKYHDAEPYRNQIWSIALLWKRYPIQEAVALLDAALREKPQYNRERNSYLFSEHHRGSFFDAMSMTASRDSVAAMLNVGKEDMKFKEYPWSNSWQALRSLRKNKQRVGEVLYDIYRSTEDAEMRDMASSVLGCSRAIYWIKRKLVRQ